MYQPDTIQQLNNPILIQRDMSSRPNNVGPNEIVSRIVKIKVSAHWFGFCDISGILFWG